jgi:hypothetical protein
MSDFLARLVDRSLAAKPAVRPKLISLFEPHSAEGDAISPQDNRSQPPAVEKLSEAISDRISPLESLWRSSPEQTFAAGTVRPVPVLPVDTSRHALREVQTSMLRSSDEVDMIGVRAERSSDDAQAAPAHDAVAAASSEKPTAPVACAPDKDRAAESIATTKKETTTPDRRERPAPRKIFAAPELAVVAFAHESEANPSRDAPRAERQPTSAAASIALIGHQPEKERTGEAVVEIEPEITKPPGRHRRAPPKIFPAQEIQLVQPKPASIRRIPSPQPPDLPAPERSIHVTIGRVEVRATLPTPVRSQPPRASAPIMSLDEYLRERAGGSRR